MEIAYLNLLLLQKLTSSSIIDTQNATFEPANVEMCENPNNCNHVSYKEICWLAILAMIN